MLKKEGGVTLDTQETITGVKTFTSNVNGATVSSGVTIGTHTNFPGIWLTSGSPTLSNYAFLSAGDSILNSPSGNQTRLRVNNANKVSVSETGVTFAVKATFDATDASGTPGAATINKPSGQVAIAAGASSVVVTNNLVSTTSVVVAVLQQVDGTLTQILSVVPAAGSFTITGNANATAATKVGFVVFN